MKSKVKAIFITRNEGPSNLCGTTHEFNTFKKANHHLSISTSLPKQGYDKHAFTVVWENGSEYTGRIDLMHPENPDYHWESQRIGPNMQNYLKWITRHGGVEEAVKCDVMLETLMFTD